MSYFSDETFQNLTQLPESGEYENCTFDSCDFQESDFSQFQFIDCVFESCNLSNGKMKGTGLQGCSFHSCKLLGIHWEEAKEFGIRLQFDDCKLNHSSFFQMKLPRTLFRHCDLSDVDFTGSELKESSFAGSRMLNVQFGDCNLEKCDFRSAMDYRLFPDKNRIKGAKFSKDGLEGLLTAFGIIVE
ncbi:MAG: pentapeptide repeat-containing protein [Bacteroidetes bacterium]|nr:pentapeptide repeat-containing protein [Bacteroidota bacterium]